MRPLPFLFIILLAVSASAVFAQAPPPPKPKKTTTVRGDKNSRPVRINGAVRAEGDWLKEPSGKYFTAKGAYKVNFPVRPQTTKVPMDSAFGKTTLTIDIVGTALAAYFVGYFDFPSEITEKYMLDIRYNQMRDTQTQQMSGVLKKDQEFYFGSYYGREIVIEGKGKTYTGRVLLVGARMFMMAVETKGTLSTQPEKIRSSHLKRIKAFFDSFEVTAVQHAILQPVDLPEDFGVTHEGEVLTSDFLKVAWQMPEGWTFSEEVGDLLFETGKEELRNENEELAKYLTNANARLIAFVSDTDPETTTPNAVIYVLVERADFPNFLPRSAANSFIKLYLTPTETVTEPVTVGKIGGIEFASFEYYNTVDDSHSKLYFANRFGVALEFKFIYRDPADLKKMTDSLNTLRMTDE
jgi:hypothetical protein